MNMNKIWFVWFSLSLSGSLVTLIFILFKPILQKFSRTWQYYIWLLVILRFLIPLSPNVSVIGGIFQQVELYFTEESAKNEVLSESDSIKSGKKIENHSRKEVILQKAAPNTIDFSVIKQNIIGIIWFITAFVLFTYKLFRYIQAITTIKRESKAITDRQMLAALQELCKIMEIKKEVFLYVNPLLRSPMFVGLVTPSIILHDENIQASELMYIFSHELIHYRRRDFFYKWLTEMMVCLHWFNPIVYWIRTQVNRGCEFSCDEAVIAHLGYNERRSYGETLLNTIIVSNQNRKEFISFSLNENGILMKERLEAIMKYQHKSKWNFFTAFLLTVLLFFGAAYMGTYSISASGTAEAGTAMKSASTENKNSRQKVIYESVVLRFYDKEAKRYPYIHNIRVNHTNKTIVKTEQGMLAFDKKGNPLKLKWDGFISGSKPSYYFLYDWDDTKILPGKKDDIRGGWSLNTDGKDKNASKAAYILFCDKKIKFSDGSIWNNPDYSAWLKKYKGKKVPVKQLKSYYPFVQNI